MTCNESSWELFGEVKTQQSSKTAQLLMMETRISFDVIVCNELCCSTEHTAVAIIRKYHCYMIYLLNEWAIVFFNPSKTARFNIFV